MNKKIIILFQLIAAGVLAFAGAFKIFNPGENYVFSALSMEPLGRYIIGFLELFASLMLMSKNFAPLGSFLSVGVLTGAFIAHISVLGVHVNNDGGRLFIMLIVGFISSLIVLWNKKDQLSFLGLSKK